VARVDRIKLGREIELRVSRDEAVQRGLKRIAEEVQAMVKEEAPKPGPGHPYATGDFVESIKMRQTRGLQGRFIGGFTVYSDHENANFIEYGTGPDKPGSRSPWGANTPTPEFAPFGKAAHRFGGTAP
jgi:hypothetical protein